MIPEFQNSLFWSPRSAVESNRKEDPDKKEINKACTKS